MYKTILIAVDMAHPEQLPELAKAAITLAADTSSAVFHLLYVDETLVHQGIYPLIDDGSYKALRHEVKKKLHAHVLALWPEATKAECHVRQGTVHEQILEESRQIKADAILMMARRPGLASYFVGSNAERVVRHAKCTVMVLRGGY